ncbi:fam206a protein [Chrysochromulina tobinii]|uniref:Fam206a protein n=1 Tax=Chrysochromulina tobinii TaxID=1460289 RepID=A0A0M0JMR9_9EUKA|nr:fam206a protein [Chrysochromulina tobinii]|eukprot:KOO27533.1 fam206a protein [Chrysochromulina sp. CCMP291]
MATSTTAAAVDATGHGDNKIVPSSVAETVVDAMGHVDGDNKMARLGADGWAQYPSVLDRYYTTHTLSNNQRVSVHSNGLCVIGVAPSHPMLQSPLSVKAVSFRSHDGKKLGEIKVSGKHKTGAHWLNPRDLICTLTASDGSEAILYACIRGSVIEANTRLVDHPELLGTPEGYVAVIQPKAGEKKSISEACLEFDAATPLSQPSNSNKKTRVMAKPCWDFERSGKCKFGANCRFLHVEKAAATALDSGAAPAATGAAPSESSANEGDAVGSVDGLDGRSAIKATNQAQQPEDGACSVDL